MSINYQVNTMDPKSRAFLDQLNAMGIPSVPSLSLEDARKLTDSFAWQSTIELGAIEDISIAGPHGEIPIRIYVPQGKGPFGVLVYYHGGGWVLGSILHKDPVCRYLCKNANIIVVSVDYRRAPEHKFPKPLEECYQALCWTSTNIAHYGGNPDVLAVGGDSSGGNLAAATTLLARDKAGPKIACQVLIFPVTNDNFDTRSYKAFAKDPIVPREDMIWYWDQYLNTPFDGKNPYASPLKDSDDTGVLPPAVIVLAEFDPLFDEGEAYAKKLQAANVSVALYTYPTFHGFIDFYNKLDLGRKALDDICSELIKFRP